MLSNNELNIIIQGCINQNSRNQEELYKFFYGFSAAICMRYVQKQDHLVEIVNDGFLKIYKELRSFNMPIKDGELVFRAWLKRIMINTSIDYYRKFIKNEPVKVDVEDKVDGLEYFTETAIEKMSYDELISLIQQLSPMYKLVFNMYVIDGMSHQEIADELKISIGTSKSNLSKARLNVIKLIEKKSYSAI